MERKCFAVFGIIEGLPEGEGKILLIHDKGKPSPAMWKLPGGRSNIEIEECPEYALIREIDEEVKITIMLPDKKDVVLEKNLENHIFKVYKAKYYDGKINAGEEVEWIKLFSVNEINSMILANEILPKHAQALTKYILGF